MDEVAMKTGVPISDVMAGVAPDEIQGHGPKI